MGWSSMQVLIYLLFCEFLRIYNIAKTIIPTSETYTRKLKNRPPASTPKEKYRPGQIIGI
jgi:hypothetical protein